MATQRQPCFAMGWLLTKLAGLVRHAYLDRPRPRGGSDGPNASLKTWLAAAPAMMIMEPMATYWRMIARRSSPQFFDILWACGPRSWR
jgi:hypothetical protein